jgi:hypothetical protein
MSGEFTGPSVITARAQTAAAPTATPARATARTGNSVVTDDEGTDCVLHRPHGNYSPWFEHGATSPPFSAARLADENLSLPLVRAWVFGFDGTLAGRPRYDFNPTPTA